ncbi:MAG: pyridoxal-phosphate dependent enzyme [Chloroflexota bacterium]
MVSNFTPAYDLGAIGRALDREAVAATPAGLWRWGQLLPVDDGYAVTLQEGGTPLLACARLGERLGLERLYVKDESRNPTGSFKDRMASVVVSKARETGASAVTISSSGNAGAALATYAARAGLDCVVFTYGQAAMPMKVQMQAAGAKLVTTPAAADRWTLMRACVERYGWYPASNYLDPPVGSNPYGVDAYKTISFEIAQQLDWHVPEHVLYPVCYGDGLWGGVKGWLEMRELGWIDTVPRVHAGEVWGSISAALESGAEMPARTAGGPTVGISIGASQSTYQAVQALRRVNGLAGRVSDEEMLAMQKTLAETEGIFAEASSTPSLVLAARLLQQGAIKPDETVVAVVTATGLKDPEMAASRFGEPPLVQPEIDDLQRVLGDVYGWVASP